VQPISVGGLHICTYFHIQSLLKQNSEVHALNPMPTLPTIFFKVINNLLSSTTQIPVNSGR